jgi:hypothetical protein
VKSYSGGGDRILSSEASEVGRRAGGERDVDADAVERMEGDGEILELPDAPEVVVEREIWDAEAAPGGGAGAR